MQNGLPHQEKSHHLLVEASDAVSNGKPLKTNACCPSKFLILKQSSAAHDGGLLLSVSHSNLVSHEKWESFGVAFLFSCEAFLTLTKKG